MKRNIVWMSVLALMLTGCGLASSQINETCLVYSGGVIEDKEFEQILKPGSTNNRIGVGSDSYCYPNDQRSWISNPNNNEGGNSSDAPRVEVVSKDEVRLLVPYQLYFTLNTTEDVLVEFHENIGVKTTAWTPDGWRDMLNTYFAPQVDRAMDEAALKFEWRALRSSEETRLEFQREVVNSLKTKVNEVIGGDYFCGPAFTGEDTPCGNYTFTVGKPEPTDDNLSKSIEREQLNQQEIRNQRVENERRIAELEAVREQIDTLGPQVFACLEQSKVAAEAGLAPPPCFFGGENAAPVVDVSN